MNNFVTLSIIVINYNTFELTKECIEFLIAARKKTDSWEVIIVDNGSTDGSGDTLYKLFSTGTYSLPIRVLLEERNGGFARGNNTGIRASVGKFVLLLNSDTHVMQDAIQHTLAVFSDGSVGAATCTLVLQNGKIDPACHRGFPTPWAAVTYFSGLERIFPNSPLFSQYHLWFKDMATIHEIDAPSGAFFMIRKEVIERVGFLDEEYFMYGEDIDWAYRIKKKKYKILFVPDGKVIHLKNKSGRKSLDLRLRKKTNENFYQTMKLFYRKHYEKKYPRWLTFFITGLLDFRIFWLRVWGI